MRCKHAQTIKPLTNSLLKSNGNLPTIEPPYSYLFKCDLLNDIDFIDRHALCSDDICPLKKKSIAKWSQI